MVWPTIVRLSLQDRNFLVSGVCSFVVVDALEASAGLVVGGASAYQLVSRAGSWSSGGQGYVQRWLQTQGS